MIRCGFRKSMLFMDVEWVGGGVKKVGRLREVVEFF